VFGVPEPDSRTAPSRRPGRAAILDRAADRFAEAGLEQVVGAVAGVRDVAAAAGVAPATVNHHFPPGGDRRNARLAAAALGRALLGGPSGAGDERATVARLLALAVAPRSTEAAELLRADHDALHAEAVAGLELRLAADGRRPAPGLDVDALAGLVLALADGVRARARFGAGGLDEAAAVDLLVARCTEPAAGAAPASGPST
jgi:AcrR family transcriptional regulator